MGQDWFDFVGIHDDTIILYGHRADGTNFHRELNADERERVCKLTRKHDVERDRLLRELADAQTPPSSGTQS